MASGGAVGAGVAGLAVIAALLLLLLLFKKKKSQKDVMPEEETMSETQTMDEMDEYISEYGLSDGGFGDASGQDSTDMPHVIGGDGQYVSDEGNASEHNPEDEDEFGLSGGEM
jgi:hypothetical protein